MTYDEAIASAKTAGQTARLAVKEAIDALISATGLTSTQATDISAKIESLASASTYLLNTTQSAVANA